MNTYICLENLRSLLNIGAIFRSCSFFSVNKVILLGYSGITHDQKGNKILHPDILKTSLGSENDLEIKIIDNLDQLSAFSKENSLEIISIEQTQSSQNIHEYIKNNNFKNKIVVFGNEATGVTKELLQISKVTLEIPKLGGHNSLNVATTCGIVLDIITSNLPN